MTHRLIDSFKRVLLVSLLFASCSVSAAKIAGENFDDQIRLADTDLVLNGVGVRAVLMFKGYAAGLYLKSKGSSLEQVLAVKGAKRIQMKLLLDVDAKEFVKAIDVGMRRNSTEAEHIAIKDRIAAFEHEVGLLGAFKKGDLINLDFIPAQGLVVVLNGKTRGEPIPGEDMYAGVMKIFIGELPVDKKLKAGLLGNPAP